jgi:hypothetical protein
MYRTAFEAALEKNRAVKISEATGEVADSMPVRLALMKRVHDGEITLAEAQQQLRKIQNTAKETGQLTRAQVFKRG